ncbi:MAG: hypothetical protein JSV56_06650, partial [Methanomassiliicoccales archaeon]
MDTKKRYLMILLSMVLGALLVFGSNIQAQGEELAAEQVLNISLETGDLQTADPHYASGTQDRVIVDMVFNSLIRYKHGAFPEIEPDLATAIPKPEMVDGKQVWKFQLRRGIMTHPFSGYPNGYELTSEDVVYSLKRAADPARSAWAGEYPDWIHFEAVDKYTVKVTLDKPLSPTLFLPKFVDWAGGFIVPKKAIEKLGPSKFKTQPVGTGPFIFKKYLPKERVVFDRHPNYFRGKPILEKVNAIYIADVSAAEMGLKKGELHVVMGPSEQPWVEKMEAAEGIIVDVFPPGENVNIYYNTKKPPLDSLDVRKAIAYALSRKDFIALFGERIATPTYSPVPFPFQTGGLAKEDLEKAGISWEVGPHDLDLKRAKDLLAKAGYPNGFKLEVYSSQRAYYLKPFEIVQAQLRKIGIDLKIKVVDHAAYHSLIRKDANPLVFYNAWRGSADIYLTNFFHSTSRVVVGKSPNTNFAHSEMVDKLIEKARFESDPKKQEVLWKEAHIELAKNVCFSTFCLIQLTDARSVSLDWGKPLKAARVYGHIDWKTKILK